MPMAADLKEKWLEALRSRKFKQGKGALKEIDPDTKKASHCCLGVLHEINSGKWHKHYFYDEEMCTGGRKGVYSSNTFLDGPFSKGLTEEEQRKLAGMNDSGKKFY